MKKIGILTFHDTTNFGAVLQAVATYKAIEELGVECEIINYHCKNIDNKELPKRKYDIRNLEIRSLVHFLFMNKKHIHKHDELMIFLESEAKVSDEYYTRETISKADCRYSKFIVGSDMLWCVEFTSSDYTYMLDFVSDNNKKVAFATSVGFHWDNREEIKIKELLNKFKFIAVREKDTSVLLADMLKKNIETVCDPTMLISPEIWRAYAEKSKNRKKYCLVYMDDKEKNCLKNARKYGNQNCMPVYVMGLRNFPRKGYVSKEVLRISDFLGHILSAEILFTASYHGMLFAVYFHVPFVFYNKDQSRLINLAEKLGVSDRNGNLYSVSEMKAINWKTVDEKREQYATFSKNILSGIIHEE